jgi:hypothetical protein
MKTFILLTFGFLGFAFYQMSGGAEFESASARLAQTQPTEKPAEPTTLKVIAVTETPDPAVTVSSITKIDTTPAAPRVAAALPAPIAPAQDAPQPVENVTTARIIDSAETPQIILPSLIASSSTNTVTGDVRTVSGNRVNVRGGPSTNYGIVSKLTRGETVRILEDNGDGWVRMEPVEGGEAGWMADFLLTAG